MAKTKYVARLPNGETLTRGSARTYSHAWLVVAVRSEAHAIKMQAAGFVVTPGAKIGESGFSGSRALAEKALASAIGYYATCGEITYSGMAETEVV